MIKSTNRLIYTDSGRLSDCWAYQLESDKTFEMDREVPSFVVTTINDQQQIATMQGNTLTICAGYCWDGLTCWNDTAANMIGGLPHDLGYQLGGCHNTPFTRKEIDGWLRDLIAPRSPWEAPVTYAGVRLCGWKFYGKKSNIKIRIL